MSPGPSRIFSQIKEAVKATPFGDWLLQQEATLRWQLRKSGADFSGRAPLKDWLNTTLQSVEQAEEAKQEVLRCGLPTHPDLPKNWDALSTLKHILDSTPSNANVLEVGAPLYSVILQWLYLYGYRNLQGIDLVYDKAVRRGPISYQYGDLTCTHFKNENFDAIVSLSVIEHNVNLTSYFKEMARLLKTSGRLYTSTDYWHEQVDTGAQEAYGGPIKIFNRADVGHMLEEAERFGLYPIMPLNLDCQDKAVHWKRFDLRYTFLCFALEKR